MVSSQSLLKQESFWVDKFFLEHAQKKFEQHLLFPYRHFLKTLLKKCHTWEENS